MSDKQTKNASLEAPNEVFELIIEWLSYLLHVFLVFPTPLSTLVLTECYTPLSPPPSPHTKYHRLCTYAVNAQ